MREQFLTEIEIQELLYYRFKGILLVPNTNILGWESDFVVITKALFIHEFEIKRTRSDFLNDKKKWRTKQMDAWKSGERKYKPWARYDIENDIPRPANYFWYVCPDKMITADELPDGAGLMVIAGNSHLKTERTAARIHREKLDMKHILQVANSLNFRYWRYRIEARAKSTPAMKEEK